MSKHQNMKMLIFDVPLEEIKSVNTKLKEDLLDLKRRSMRDNLIFTNIPQEQEEDTEQVLVGFLQNKLNLTDIKIEKSPSYKTENSALSRGSKKTCSNRCKVLFH